MFGTSGLEPCSHILRACCEPSEAVSECASRVATLGDLGGGVSARGVQGSPGGLSMPFLRSSHISMQDLGTRVQGLSAQGIHGSPGELMMLFLHGRSCTSVQDRAFSGQGWGACSVQGSPGGLSMPFLHSSSRSSRRAQAQRRHCRFHWLCQCLELQQRAEVQGKRVACV